MARRKPPNAMARMDRIADVGLGADQLLDLIVAAFNETAAMSALVMIHGVELGYARYCSSGGCMRVDAHGDAWIPVVCR